MSTHHYWTGKAAVVTGGARGQGAAITLQLMRDGAHVHVLDRLPSSDPAWIELHKITHGLAGKLTVHAMDVADPQAWIEASNQIKTGAEPLFGLVNNAGITGIRNTVTKTDLAEWERVLQVNLTGSFLGIKTLAPLMPKGGAIVSISSTVGLTGYFSAAYSTSKWALRGLTKSAAMELASAGVRVNCICPGVVDTEMIRNNQKLFDALQTITPMGHMAQADQLADAMFFLLGPQSAYITGVDLAVDGGLTSGGIFWPVGRAMGAL
jgi:NAD(P)-dependent dehydrogenase (short-subunit alcohol dehydrogenase family)